MIEGIFWEEKELNVGAMGTQKVTDGAHVLHYWIKENDKGIFEVFYLKPDGAPTAIVMETVDKQEFEKRFKDCSSHSCQFKKKTEEEEKEGEAQEKVRLGEKHLNNKEFNAATFEFGNALKKDEKNLHAHFGKGKAHIALGEVDKAKEHFTKMSESEELYGEEHKHLFNELGIELRKNEMHSEAINNYTKAIEIDKDDPVLYYNIARAYREWGKKSDAMENIRKAIELNPKFGEALALLKTLQ